MGDGTSGPSATEVEGISQTKPKLDTLVVLGKGWNHNKAEREKDPLSGRSKLIADAAAQYFLAGGTEKMVLSGGYTKRGMSTEASAMRDYIMGSYPEIPQESMILEENSIDTATNARESQKVLSKMDSKRVGMITTGDHIQRSSQFFRNFNIPLDEVIAAESIIPNTSPYYPPGSESYLKKVRRKEAVLRLIQKVDPKGRLVYPLALAARRLR